MEASEAQPPTVQPLNAGNEASFSDDPHISFDQATGKWHYEADDGKEFEYDVIARAWVPILDEELLKAQQAAYSVPGVDEEAPAAPVLKRAKKRKEVDYTSNTAAPPPIESGPSAAKKGKKNAKGEKIVHSNDSGDASTSSSAPPPPPPSKNTAVYVTGLPPDTTAAELASRFSKFGVLMEDDQGAPKIKLYADEQGQFNGEALVVYFMEDSVELAITMLDEAELRLGEPGTTMHVKKGEFGHKSTGANAHDGKATVKRVVDKRKATARINKMKSKLADWDSSDEDDPRAKEPVSKSRTVLLKHMFSLEDLEKDPALLLDLKDEVREESETLGEVTNVVLYDLESEGLMTVKFKDPVSAQACVIKMNGRFFDGKKIVATLFDGKTSKFRRSDRSGPAVNDDDEEESGGSKDDEKKRLDAFASWLEQGGDAKPTAASSGASTS